jgi:hypothetical protein
MLVERIEKEITMLERRITNDNQVNRQEHNKHKGAYGVASHGKEAGYRQWNNCYTAFCKLFTVFESKASHEKEGIKWYLQG